jgi:putative SOS response-associated peptidase YedK
MINLGFGLFCGLAAWGLGFVTCAVNATVAPIHNRMQVILDEAAAEDWMNPREPNPPSYGRLQEEGRCCSVAD